jgi:Flp pilus assembly CpaF family ATPase
LPSSVQNSDNPAPVFTIRRMAVKVFTLADYVASGTMTEPQRLMIERAVRDRLNILVVGETTTGKTTLTNAILRYAEAAPNHRIVIIEDTVELQGTAKNYVMLRISDNVDQLRLLKTTMRLRPDRICLGEARGPEALALLKAWDTGHPGGVCTVQLLHPGRHVERPDGGGRQATMLAPGKEPAAQLYDRTGDAITLDEVERITM